MPIEKTCRNRCFTIVCVCALRNTRDSCQTHGCRGRKNPHRERFAKKTAKEKTYRTKIIGVLVAVQMRKVAAHSVSGDSYKGPFCIIKRPLKKTSSAALPSSFVPIIIVINLLLQLNSPRYNMSGVLLVFVPPPWPRVCSILEDVRCVGLG